MEDRDDRGWWWQDPIGDCHELLIAQGRQIDNDQIHRRTMIDEYRRLYDDRVVELLKADKKVTYNVARSCTDTVTSKFAKNKPRVEVLTSGADYIMQEKAKGLTKFLDGSFDEQHVYQKMRMVSKDACVDGTGMLYIYKGKTCVECDRVDTKDVFVDQLDGEYGEPRCMTRKYRASRYVLAAQYPEHKEAIMAAKRDTNYARQYNRTDVVTVWESWHLPSGDDEIDGRHAIVVDGATLVDEEWTHQWFPLVRYHWCEPTGEFWGGSLVEELRGHQYEINRVIDTIRVAQRRMGRPVIWIPRAANVAKGQIANEIAATYLHDGDKPPKAELWPAMPAEVYDYLETLIRRAYEVSGVSQANASSQKPPSVISQVAIQEVNDLETERFILNAQRHEEAFIEIARVWIALSKEMYEEGIDPKVKSREKRFLSTIKWSEVDMDEDSFYLRMFPASILPTQPGGRIDRAGMLIEMGVLSQERAAKLLLGETMDIEDEVSLISASVDVIRMTLSKMKSGGKYIPPEPFMDLAMAQKLTQLEIMRCQVETGVKEENIDKLRTYLAQVTEMLEASRETTTPQAPPNGNTGQPESDPGLYGAGVDAGTGPDPAVGPGTPVPVAPAQ